MRGHRFGQARERIPEPRLTLKAVWLAFVWIGLPILLIGGALDLVGKLCEGILRSVGAKKGRHAGWKVRARRIPYNHVLGPISRAV